MPGSERSARFRIAVIGEGLIGSAAARHLAMQTDGVAVTGPDEPAVRADHHDVFGSHYDEGRIYRTLDRDLIWARLAARSIERYAEIKEQSGVQFHAEVGVLAASATATGYPYVDEIVDGRLYVAVGGNGKAAKSSDEIGRLAAELTLSGTWQDGLPADAFRVRLAGR